MTNWYCCGKQREVLLNRFLIKELNHKLNLLCHLPLSSIIDEKIRPPTSFSTHPPKKCQPSPLLTTPHLQKISTPTSILTIRSLYIIYTVSKGLAQGPWRGSQNGIRTHDLPIQRHRINQCAQGPWRGNQNGIRTHDLPIQRHRINQCATRPPY